MSVIDMVAQTLAKQLAEQGPDMIAKLVGNLPPDVLHTIGQIRDTVLSYKAQLDRIENQNRLIIAHLNIPAGTDITEHDNARERDRSFQPQS